MMMMRFQRSIAAAVTLFAGSAFAQSGPVQGMRPGELRSHAVTGATIVVSPGETIQNATILIREGVIESVGADVDIPDETRVWDATGLTIYPGLIDAAVLVDTSEAAESVTTSAGAHWNPRVHPQLSLAELDLPEAKTRKQMRELGFAAAAVYPADGVFRGSGVVLGLSKKEDDILAYEDKTAMAVGFEYGGGWRSATYPGSLMGAIALIRQTLLDAKWHHESRRVWREYPQGNKPPIRADALYALASVVNQSQPVLFEVSNEKNALRAAELIDQYSLDATLLGSGLEFRRLGPIVGTGLPLIVPIDFPETPDVSSIARAQQVTLREMMTWEQAPTNLRRLLDAGATVALSTHSLKKRKNFFEKLRKAIDHGLSEEQALAALTTTPAEMLGLSDVLGSIEPGKAANFVTVKGNLFDKEMKIREVWINGIRHEISRPPAFQFAQRGKLTTDAAIEATITIDPEKSAVTLIRPDEGDNGKEKKYKARKTYFQRDRISFILPGEALNADGPVRMSAVKIGDKLIGKAQSIDGGTFEFTVTAENDSETGETSDDKADENDEETQQQSETASVPEKLVVPFGAYGLSEQPEQRDVCLLGATLWTAGEKGVIENGAVVIRDGRIASVVEDVTTWDPPGDVEIINLEGRHITPGLIDCHSHTGIDGRVNEWTQVNTAEVRIQDVIDPDDINWYRQLAGGLTVANQLHGSANPIGGQNAIVKLKWSGLAEDFLIDSATPGIKFALGENVIRSKSRYPNTRMGVETIIRDAFTAAKQYEDKWKRYTSDSTNRERTMPPRRNIELQTLVEILNSKRDVHCHSYRQDEVLMLIRLAEDFGFTLGTLQHILEGYKVAEAIASHGVGASTFSDWWAYKVEVQDAIPYNAALMERVGVLVSINSDSSELARRMNIEAAKAVRYGDLGPHEALKLVTIKPAKQLGIADRVGSLEKGKDADLAIWSGDPLSTYNRCEQTWIEGAKYFDLDEDQAMREKVQSERQRLMAKILQSSQREKRKAKKKALEKIETGEVEPEEVAEEEPREPESNEYSCCHSVRHH